MINISHPNFPSKKICTSKAVWLKDRPGTTRDETWWCTKSDVKDIWMFPKIVGFPPKSSIKKYSRVFFSLFSPSILGCFPPILGNTHFLSMAHYHVPQGGVILRKFSPGFQDSSGSFTWFVLNSNSYHVGRMIPKRKDVVKPLNQKVPENTLPQGQTP